MARYFRRTRYRTRTRYIRGRSRRYGGGNKWLTFGAGAAAGWFAPNVVPFQNELALLLAVAPVKLPRAVRSLASGYIIGRMGKNVVSSGIGTGTGGNSPWI